jgi:hypothetical protein
MTIKTKTALKTAGVLLAMTLVFAAVQSAMAVTPGLYEVAGNPNCGDLYQATVISGPDTSLADLGPLFGFKYDANPLGDLTHTLTNDSIDMDGNGEPDWVVTNGPQDPNNSVSIFNVVVSGGEGVQFDWSATLGIDAVIVKAQDANAYVYSPEAFGAAGLVAPDGRAISHISFCYDYEVDVSKTADTTFTRTYEWTITKEFDGTYDKFIGDPATSHGYEVSVDKTGFTDSDWAVTGSILIENNTPFDATIETVTDVISDDITVDPDCGVSFPFLLTSGSSLTCSYSSALTDGSTRTNTATVTTTGVVGGEDATAEVIFGDPTTEVNASINVSDTNGEFWTTTDTASWTYSRDFVCSSDQANYTDGFYSFNHLNTATIDETGQSDDATVTVNCYAPVPSKDADTSYTRTFTWEITKITDGTYDKFIGDPATSHGYEVSVDQTVTESAFAVNGTITVHNPNPSAAMTVSLSDSVGGTPATLGCGGTLVVPAGGSATCGYSADLLSKTDGTNTATVTLNSIDFSATADYVFGDPTTIIGSPTINVTDTNGEYWTASGDTGWIYGRDFVCSTNPADYSDGFYSFIHTNTATIVETGQSDDATVTVNCYAPIPSKDANTYYTRQYDWTITKDYDGTYDKFIGDPATSHLYQVSVDQTVSEYDYAVDGTITVQNPNPSAAMTVSLSDSVGGTPATLGCGGTLVVPAGGSATCDYSANLASKTDGTNTATVTLNSIDFGATADYEFGMPTNVIGNPIINVSDTNGESWMAYDDESWTYSRDFVCSSDPTDYTDGFYSFTHTNKATIVETGQSDDAEVNVNCYAPVITKDASASYDERHDWNVIKTVTDPVGPFYPGDTPSWTWTIDIIETVVDQNFAISGDIDVTNPAGSPGSITVALSDVLDDGTSVNLVCDGSLTVAPGATETCGYSAIPNDASATLNTATGTFNSIDFVATANVSFVKNVVNDDAAVSDTEIGLTDESVSGGDQFTAIESGLCSSDREIYGAEGAYTVNGITNTAILTDEEDTEYTSTATTSYTCEASFVDIYKTTNGAPADPTKDIVFTLYGPGGPEEQSTLGNGADIQFQTALVPGAQYTICENPVPAGYTFEILINGGNVLTYAGDATGAVQCFDFIADPSGTTLTFSIENSFPGGAPRTPGYWKNWSTCSGGNQAETAAKLGGVAEGVFLLDDLLPQTIGSLDITSCEDGVLILDARKLVGKNKNASNDAAYTLARALLAARLNQDAGACVPYTGFEQVLDDADNLLASIGFDGTGDYLDPKNKKEAELRADALYLYGIIDNYNNGYLCTGEPSH